MNEVTFTWGLRPRLFSGFLVGRGGWGRCCVEHLVYDGLAGFAHA